MNARMQASLLADGRLHLNDGPIDLMIYADGAGRDASVAFEAACVRFSTILDELCAELPHLRAASDRARQRPSGVVARRMDAATRPLCEQRFITPMAAVAGAVADEVLAAMLAATPLRRAYVNNGGDIALHMSGDATLKVGLVDLPVRPNLFGGAVLSVSHGVRGVATSGWRGRSFSLGIADAATALAADAARADAAATLIANAVDLPGHRNIVRAPASEFDSQSDLGDRLVTRHVGALSDDDVAFALARGEDEARRLMEVGAIIAASVRLRGATRVIGSLGAPRTFMRSNDDTTIVSDPTHGRENAKWRQISASS